MGTGIAVVLLLIAGVKTAQADPLVISGTLISGGTRDFTGQGFGVVLPILTLQNNGSEQGGIGFNGTSDFTFENNTGTGAENGDVKDEGVHSRTYSFQDLINGEITNVNNLGVIYNVNQQGNQGGITTQLNDVRIGVWTSTGTFVWSSGTCSGSNPTCPGPFVVTNQGQGGDGYLFTVGGLNSTDLALWATFFANPTSYRIGLWSSIGTSNDGPEDFYLQPVVCTVNCGPDPIPEPATLLLVGSGILGAAARWRRRKVQI